MKIKVAVAIAVFVTGLTALAFATPPADRDAVVRSLNDANVTYIAKWSDGRGATIHVLSNENVCDVLAKHPDVPVSVYNAVTGEAVTCK